MPHWHRPTTVSMALRIRCPTSTHIVHQGILTGSGLRTVAVNQPAAAAGYDVPSRPAGRALPRSRRRRSSGVVVAGLDAHPRVRVRDAGCFWSECNLGGSAALRLQAGAIARRVRGRVDRPWPQRECRRQTRGFEPRGGGGLSCASNAVGRGPYSTMDGANAIHARLPRVPDRCFDCY